MAYSQRSPEMTKSSVISLLQYLDSLVQETGTFAVSLNEICDRFDIPLVEAYRALYQHAPALGGYVRDSFTPEETVELTQLIAQFGSVDVHQLFRSAGALLSTEDLAELAALYFDRANATLHAHNPQREEFQQMCTRFKRARRAFEVYLDYFFDRDALFEDTVSDFTEACRPTFPDLGRFTARRHLRLLCERHIISFESVFEQLFRRLTNQTETEPRAHSGALQALGLTRLPSDKRSLRIHYKALMKTYHPDINPGGLEMSKKINAAYAELLANWSV